MKQDLELYRSLERVRCIHNTVGGYDAKAMGCNPERECFMRAENGGWRISFEAGPYQWAIVASEALCQSGIFAEPHYSFDLCFYPE
jgi:hypothetical protein